MYNLESKSPSGSTSPEMDVDEYIRRRRRSSVVDVIGTQRRASVEIFLNRRRASIEQSAPHRRGSIANLLPLPNGEGTLFREENPPLGMGRRQYSSEPLWENVKERSFVKYDKKWKENLLDKRLDTQTSTREVRPIAPEGSLYSIKNENIAEQDLGFCEGPKFSNLGDRVANVEQKIERDYIKKSRLIDNSHNLFSKAIMQHFYKAPAPKSHPGYGMPRPETSENNPFRLMMNDLNREPSIVHINNFPTMEDPIRCKDDNEFCEILGPSSCSNCIENTNRSIADELQRVWFPKIEISRKRLVKPKLSKVMREGHFLQIRKKRMDELQLPYRLSPMRRQESQIDSKKIHSATFPKIKRRRSKNSALSQSSFCSNLSAVPEEVAA